MKKTIALTLLAAGSTLALSGCFGGTDTEDTPDVPASQEDTQEQSVTDDDRDDQDDDRDDDRDDDDDDRDDD